MKPKTKNSQNSGKKTEAVVEKLRVMNAWKRGGNGRKRKAIV